MKVSEPKPKTTNKTRLVWGEPFKNMIKTVTRELELRRSLRTEIMSIDDANLIDDVEIDIRHYVIEHQHRFPGIYENPNTRLSGDSNSFPDHYAIMISITEVDNLDNYNGFLDMIETLRSKEIIELENLADEDHLYGDNDQLKCSCGHTIKMNNSFLIRNSVNGMTLLLGSECIEKSDIVSYETLNAAKLKHNAVKKRIKEIKNELDKKIKNYQKTLRLKQLSCTFEFIKSLAKRSGRLDILGFGSYRLMTYHKFMFHKHHIIVDYRNGFLDNFWGFSEDKISTKMREAVIKYNMYKQNIEGDLHYPVT
jgi:hypothetical protein